ncbi:Rpp20 subunit of nuclear RNase MRP and P-domain-containing protein [Coniella lustricola]|uniref:Rpp20 subunit of nuclear RNase MRP and P-domain-containing protein n=1 Tax=Coniella lustricola TaxID=2025994 RepID=A0A2T2ZU38_9PEZI|nr:Rpp20 subunit of nuclear RNase MRP and P-domain-containing protein [Coniella lustricola]
MSRTQTLNRGAAVSPKQRIIYVGTHSPFMSIISRVRKALDNGPAGVHANASTKGLPLTARIAALHVPPASGAAAAAAATDRQETLVRGTGRAIAKTLEVAAWFTMQADVAVSLRTMTLEAVDDVVVDEDGAEEEGGFAEEHDTRARMVNCVEVGVCLR